MNCRVLFFGPLTDVTGCAEWTCPLPENATAGDVLEFAFETWPALRTHAGALRLAVNLDYAALTDPVPPGAEVALIPPVQGG